MRTAAGIAVCLILAFASPAPSHAEPLPTLDPPAPSFAAVTSIGPAEIPAPPMSSLAHARHAIANFAMKLRNIAYRSGGRKIDTGFDCSGFVHYVFDRTLGLELPSSSAAQYGVGRSVDRDGLKMGDLVFFRIRGRHVSHVGIYLDNGLFIHAPSTGKRVRIDRLDASYWSRRFVGARRPDALTS